MNTHTSLKVAYACSSGTHSGCLDSMIYPKGRGLNHVYNSGLDSTSSVSPLTDDGRSDNAAYDNLNRLITFRRGALSASGNNSGGSGLDTVTSLNGNSLSSQVWTLDAVGNQTAVNNDNAPAAQTNTVNSQNEETGFGASTLTFDNDGNTTTDDQGHTLVYDGWNRLVAVKNGGTTLVSYAYDALGNRITRTATGTTDFYNSSAGQVLEERQAGAVTNQYVWSLAYVNTPVLRDDNTSGGSYGKSGSGLGQRVYVQEDANFNVTALTDTSGNVLERFVYSPYGVATVIGSTTAWSTASDTLSWVYTFQGGRYDAASGMEHFGAREYSPTLSRWVQMDPLEYPQGLNRYQMELSSPIRGSDITGTLDDVGHYWATLTIALLAGWDEGSARELAYWAQYPDLDPRYNALNILEHQLDRTKRFQDYLHSLTRDPAKRRCILKHMLQQPGLLPWEQGILVHALGDAYAHTFTLFGHEIGFVPPIGHLFGGNAPDHIGNNPESFKDYARWLYGYLGGDPNDPTFQDFIASVPTRPARTFLDDAGVTHDERNWAQGWVAFLINSDPGAIPAYHENDPDNRSIGDIEALIMKIKNVEQSGCCK